MKTMLILNGGHSELTLIEEAQKLGYYVITSGNRPDLIGQTKSDRYIFGDYSDPEQMLELAKESRIDAVCSCANDFGAISAAYIAEKMGLPGHDSYEVTRMLHQKDRFKQFAREMNLQSPVSDIYTDLLSALQNENRYEYPLIVKPSDLTGGKGVSRVDNAQEYEKAVRYAFERSRKKSIVVERFVEGTYHSLSTFLLDRKVRAFFSDNEYSFVNRYFVDTSAGPADDAERVIPILIREAERIAEKLQLVNGVFHMQYVMDEQGTPYIMDITRRCSGDLYPEPVEHATGIPWSKWIVMAEAGFPSDAFSEPFTGQHCICGRHCIMADRNGSVEDVFISPELKKNIYKQIVWWKPDDLIYDYQAEKMGILFLEYESRDEMEDKVSRIKDLVKVAVKD